MFLQIANIRVTNSSGVVKIESAFDHSLLPSQAVA
jgi:hypothetical protein